MENIKMENIIMENIIMENINVENVSNGRCVGTLYRVNESNKYRIYLIQIKDLKLWDSYFMELPKNTIISVLKTDVNEFNPNIFHGSIEYFPSGTIEVNEGYITYGVFDFTKNLTLLDESMLK